MKKFLIFALFFLIGFLQNNILPFFTIFGVLPNVVLVFAFTLIIFGYEKEGAIFSFFQGLWLDLASFHFFGLYTLLNLLAINLFLAFKKFLARKLLASFLVTMLLSILVRMAISFPTIDFFISIKGGLIDGAVFLLFLYPVSRLTKQLFHETTLQLDFKDYL